MNRRTALFIAATALAFASLSAGAQTVHLKMLSSWDEVFDSRVIHAERYLKLIEERSGGRIKTEIRGPETVPPFKQLEPAKAGLFDLLHTHGVYHFGEKGLAASVDGVIPGPVKRREVGIYQLVDEFYQKTHGLKLVALPSDGVTGGYHIMLRRPIAPDGDLSGLKIRGTRTYHGVIRALGGSPVVLPPGEIYTALERGVVDGTGFTTTGALKFKWHEVAKFRVRPLFGVANYPILMNLRKFNDLSPDMQKILLDVGRQLEIDALKVSDELQAKEDAELDKLGMRVLQLSPANSAKVKRAWSESVWELAKECCGETGEKLRDLAVKNNMAF